jgi:hypothetical protein
MSAIKPLLTGGNGKSNDLIGAFAGQVPVWDATTGWNAGSQAYDLRGRFVGNPASTLVIDTFVADRAISISNSATEHQFYCSVPPASGTVVLTIAKKAIIDGADTTIFTATFNTAAVTPIDLNGLYKATITPGTNCAFLAGDIVTVTVGTTQAAFSTPVWTIYGSTP